MCWVIKISVLSNLMCALHHCMLAFKTKHMWKTCAYGTFRPVRGLRTQCDAGCKQPVVCGVYLLDLWQIIRRRFRGEL